MNIALRDVKGDAYYLASVRRVNGSYAARSKRLNKDGIVLSLGQEFSASTEREATERIRHMVKIKVRKRGWVPIGLECLPPGVVRHLEVPPEMQVSPEELVLILRQAHLERYVVFGDNSGLEEYFDIGVQYLGFEMEDKYTVKVFDRFGVLRECFTNRMSSVEPTERAVETNG